MSGQQLTNRNVEEVRALHNGDLMTGWAEEAGRIDGKICLASRRV